MLRSSSLFFSFSSRVACTKLHLIRSNSCWNCCDDDAHEHGHVPDELHWLKHASASQLMCIREEADSNTHGVPTTRHCCLTQPGALLQSQTLALSGANLCSKALQFTLSWGQMAHHQLCCAVLCCAVMCWAGLCWAVLCATVAVLAASRQTEAEQRCKKQLRWPAEPAPLFCTWHIDNLSNAALTGWCRVCCIDSNSGMTGTA